MNHPFPMDISLNLLGEEPLDVVEVWKACEHHRCTDTRESLEALKLVLRGSTLRSFLYLQYMIDRVKFGELVREVSVAMVSRT